MVTINLPYGQDKLPLNIPDGIEWELVKPKSLIPVQDVKKEISRALNEPIGAPSLRSMLKSHYKVAIVASDVTRDYLDDEVVPALVQECLASNVPRENIVIVVANGTHRPITPEEMVKKYGPWVAREIRIVNHRADAPETLVFFGRSKRGIPITLNKEVAYADFRIATGGIDLHRLAGYSGGVKSMSVGVAGVETIAATHNIEVWEHPSTRLGVIEGNIFREFLTEAAAAAGLDYIVNVVRNNEHQLIRAVAGHPVAAFVEGVRLARQMSEVEVKAKADIVITCPRYPADCDLHQATKAINGVFFGPEPVIIPGGTVLIPARCQDGIGHPGIYDMLTNAASPAAALAKAREKNFVSSGELVAYKIAYGMQTAEIVMTDCQIPEATLRSMHFGVAVTIQKGLEAALASKTNPRLLILPYGTTTLPILKSL